MNTTPEKPTPEEQETAKESLTTLRKVNSAIKHQTSQLITVEGKSLLIPSTALRLLEKALDEMAAGNCVQITAIETELTTQQAADLLNVSRPHLVKLLDSGKIPFRKVGSHRKVTVKAIKKYEEELRRKRKEALQFLVDQAQEMGLGF